MILPGASADFIDRLFRPIECRGMTIPTRFALAPINTGYTDKGLPTARLRRFHSDRSGSGIGISMVGNVAVDEGGRTNVTTAVLNRDTDIAAYSALAGCIAAQGSLAGIQLARSPEDLAPGRNWKTLKISDERMRLQKIVLAYSEKEISERLSHFLVAARLAVLAGFQVIQLHAAHGYFLSLLLHPATNARVDHYAQSNSWFEELLAELWTIVKTSLLSVRLSVLTGILGKEEEISLAATLVTRAVRGGADIVDLSAGFYTCDRRLIYPDKHWRGPIYLDRLDDLTGKSKAVVTIAGRIVDRQSIPKRLPDNAIVSVGRALIADPDFVLKIRAKDYAQINHCRLMNRCHYFSRGLNSMECGVNPNL